MRRGSKLHLSSSTIEGDVLTGPQAIEEGLVDEIGIFKDVVAKEFPGASVYDMVVRDNHPGRSFISNLFYTAFIGKQNDYYKKLLRAIQGQL